MRAQTQPNLTIRLATRDDMPEMSALMSLAIAQLMPAFLTPLQVEGSHETMGIDTQLIDDGTYFAVVEDGKIVGCGGWSWRTTLYGGNHSAGRDDSPLDPAKDPARVRAMYTHPDHARKGIGKMIIDAAEAAARAKGFTRTTLGATLAGEPLYTKCGYVEVDRHIKQAANGATIPLLVMEKVLQGTRSLGD
jgi:GNAT superfamily N-acetyltransferase